MAELVKITSISQTIIHTINFSGTSRCFGGERHYTRIEAVQLSAVPGSPVMVSVRIDSTFDKV